LNPLVVAAIYAVVGLAVIPLGFELFHTKYRFLDVVLAATGGAVLSLIPTIGGPASFLATVVILYWRVGKDALVPDILASVFAARLVVFLALLKFWHS
jgi:hypothetical protein